MHYYQFNIGDYASHTRHLDLLEDLAYRRILDLYYLHERPLNGDATLVAKQIGMRDEAAIVRDVLNEFFEKTDEGYINGRADKVIAQYHSKIEQASKAGKASAERRLNARSTDVQPNINHKPITNNQEPKVKTQRGSRLPTDWTLPDDWADWAEKERPDLLIYKTADSFKDFWISKPGAGGVKLDWQATWRNWVRSQKQSFAKTQDLIHQTTPTPPNQDAALRKIEEDAKKAAPIPENIRAKMAELLKGNRA